MSQKTKRQAHKKQQKKQKKRNEIKQKSTTFTASNKSGKDSQSYCVCK